MHTPKPETEPPSPRRRKPKPVYLEILGSPLGNIRIVGVMEPGKHYIARLEEVTE